MTAEPLGNTLGADALQGRQTGRKETQLQKAIIMLPDLNRWSKSYYSLNVLFKGASWDVTELSRINISNSNCFHLLFCIWKKFLDKLHNIITCHLLLSWYGGINVTCRSRVMILMLQQRQQCNIIRTRKPSSISIIPELNNLLPHSSKWSSSWRKTAKLLKKWLEAHQKRITCSFWHILPEKSV